MSDSTTLSEDSTPRGSTAVAPLAAMTPTAQRILVVVLQRIGWELRLVDINTATGKAVLELFRADGRWLYVSARADGEGSIERWQREETMEPGKGRRGDRGPMVYAFEDRFLGRTRCTGRQTVLRTLTDYIVENPPPGWAALAEPDMRSKLRLLMGGKENA